MAAHPQVRSDCGHIVDTWGLRYVPLPRCAMSVRCACA
jgi:hypothetical protein